MKRIIAISLLLIFFTGQINLTWATHFCGKFAVESTISLGKSEMSCGMEEYSCCKDEASQLSGPILKAEQCCDDDYYSIESDHFFSKVESQKDHNLVFLTSYVISLFEIQKSDRVDAPPLSDGPPLIETDKQVLFQTFLI